MTKKQLYQYILSLGHFCSDINQSILSAVLPFLIAAYHYDYTTAALLVSISNIFGSIVQPIFGTIADRYNKPYMMSIGVLLAGGGMALTGFVSHFAGLCIAVMISGVGVAMFHPQSAKLVSLTADRRKQGKGMSIFSFGGNLGFVMGPIVTSLLMTNFGMKGTIAFIVPSIIFAFVSIFFMKDFKTLETIETKEFIQEDSQDQWSAFMKLCLVVFGRSIISNGLSTFLALYFIQMFSQSEAFSNSLVSLYYAIGAISVLFGGGLADRKGHRKMIRSSFLIFVPAMLLFTMSDHYGLALLMLIPMACGESLSYSPMVILGQKYLPHHKGFASGVTLGLAVSVGAIICPLLGSLADLYSLKASFYVIGLIALIALIVSFLLPEVDRSL